VPASARILAITVIRTWMKTMTKDSIERTRQRHEFADFSVIVTTVALVVSLVIAATAVSIGIARADTLVPMTDQGGGGFALAVVMALAIAALGGLTAVMMPAAKAPASRD
jgi:hypothetical protein